MKTEHILVIAAATIGLLVISTTLAQNNLNSDGMSMMDMMNMSGMMGMMSDVHDKDDIDWMRKMMKSHMNFTDEEFDEMSEHCPMMSGR